MTKTHIRIAQPQDAKELLKIYEPYVLQTAITFEYTVPSTEEFEERICHTLERYPYLVAEQNGTLIGYAYAGPLHARPAYDWSVETSIYVRMDYKNHGTGRLLYQALEAQLLSQGMVSANACIAYPEKEDEYLTKDSVRFHEHLGYHMAGHFHQCASKFGRWYDMVWMEKSLRARSEDPDPVIWFSKLHM